MRPAKSPRQKNLRDTSSEFFISTCKDLFLRNKDRQIIGFSFQESDFHFIWKMNMCYLKRYMIGNPEVVKVPWREYNNFSKRFFHGPNDLFQKANKAVYDFTMDFDMKHTSEAYYL